MFAICTNVKFNNLSKKRQGYLMRTFYKLVRGNNLLMVAITQYLLQYLIIVPYHFHRETFPILDYLHFFLLVLTTVLIAAGGYVINDIQDLEIDKINKPDELIIDNHISKKQANIIYWGTVLLGAMIAIYMSWWVERPLWFLLYPISVFLLWSYSVWFKKSFLIGNIIVSFFAAGVAGIVLFPEIFSLYLKEINQETIFLIGIFSGYIFFAFSSTMMREIVKDLEDIQGDRIQGASTLPIVGGVNQAKGIAILWGLLLLTGFFFFLKTLFDQGQLIQGGLGFVLVFLPIVFANYKIYSSQNKMDFHQTSQILKLVMLAGLLFLILIVKVNF